MSKYNNIYNWILTTKKCSNDFLKILKLKDNDIAPNIDFFINATFDKKDINIPDYLLNEQKIIKDKINNSDAEWVSFSAPTSFGKTKILIDILKETGGVKIIISPTLSLCNEYFFNFSKIGLKISMSHLDSESEIYVLTPEKANLLFKKNNEIKFSLVIFDEFYEAFNEGRYFSFKDAFDYLKKNSKKIITISPKLINCSAIDSQLTPINIETNVSATSRIIHSINIKKQKIVHRAFFETFKKNEIDDGFLINEWNIKDGEKLESKIVDLINENFLNIERKTMLFTTFNKIFLYVNLFNKIVLLPKTKISLTKDFFIYKIMDYLDRKSPQTNLRGLIEKRIGYHHGKMDKYLRFLIECAYRNNELILLICNSTLSKGINLSPQILIMEATPNKENGKIINNRKIEYINTIGRAGRMTQNMFIGNVFIISKTNDSKQKIKDLISVEKEIILEIPKKDSNQKIIDFKSASLDLDRNKKKYLNVKLKEEEILFLKKIINKKLKCDYSDPELLINIITNFYNIEWRGNSKTHWYKYVKASMNNIGYTHIYNEEIKTGKVDNNDKVLSKVIDDHDSQINFYFKKLLLFVVEVCWTSGIITHDELSLFDEEEDKISKNPNWPNCFSLVFSQGDCKEDDLNEILEKAKESFSN